MKKSRADFMPLGLLDDCQDANPDNPVWEHLTSDACIARPKVEAVAAARIASKVAEAAARAKQHVAVPQSPQKPKVFSSQPTLKQLMSEYNKQFNKFGPQRPVQRVSATNAMDFRYEQIDFIDIPSIPGRILRPSRPKSNADN
jgi:hypothetical protein